MKNYAYSSVLKEEFQNFLKFRQAQGFIDKNCYVWQKLDMYLADNAINEKIISSDIVENWISVCCKGLDNGSVESFISMYNAFAKYLNSIDIPAYIQPRPLNIRRNYTPYIFSYEEIKRLFELADSGRSSKDKLSKVQFPIIMRMLYGCGLRLGEALVLKKSDVDLVEGTLFVRNGKGDKDRIVPMAPTLSTLVKQYFNATIKEKPDASYVFESNYRDGRRNCIGNHRSSSWATGNFSRLLMIAGISVPTKNHERGVCLHCLRHTFIQHSLKKHTDNGNTSYQALPMISIYVGHEDLTETQDYVHMTDCISEEIIDKTSNKYKNIFPEVPK